MRIFPASLMLLLLCGCKSAGTASSPADKSSAGARIISDASRTLPLLDLASPGAAELFAIQNPQGETIAAPSLTSPARPEKGFAPHLQVELPGTSDVLTLRLTGGPREVQPRDWRPYSQLQFRFTPDKPLSQLEVGLESAGSPAVVWQPVNVAAGTSQVRIDLLDLGAALDLSDIQALHWRTAGGASGVRFEIDQIALVDDTKWLTEPASGEGDLYVYRRGKHLFVGASQRFELEFRHGQIVRWTAGSGPNLTVNGGMGPWPVPLPDAWWAQLDFPIAYDNPQLYSAWGDQVLTREDCIEASRFRAVIRGEWHFRSGTGAADTNPDLAPGHTWQYTIYPDGAIYVSIETAAPTAGWNVPRVGYAVALDDRVGFQRLPTENRTGRGEPQFVALTRTAAGQPDLVWALQTPGPGFRQLEIASADGSRLAVTVGDWAPAAQVATAQLLRIWPADLDGLAETRAVAGDYQEPPGLSFTRGTKYTSAPGDRNHDGFNESEGCFELELDGDALTCKLDPGNWPRPFAYARIHSTAGRACWAYQDGRLLSAQGRDADNNLLLRVGRFANSPTTLEVTAQKR